MRARFFTLVTAMLSLLAPSPPALAQGAGVEIIDQGPCPTVPPTPDYVLEWAWAEGSQAEALEVARAEARRKLETTLCLGVSEARCEAAKRVGSHPIPPRDPQDAPPRISSTGPAFSR